MGSNAMHVDRLMDFINSHHPDAFINQDLLSAAAAVAVRPNCNHSNTSTNAAFPSAVCVLIDAECCLDRLYGGFYTEWRCGGQWGRVLEFLKLITNTTRSHNVQLIVMLSGALEKDRLSEWKDLQHSKERKGREALHHIRRRHCPAPKINWTAPPAIRSFLRLALRATGTTVYQTIEDHKQEVLHALRELKYDILLADGAEYLFMSPPRLMSARSLKLTFRETLETNELVMEDIAKRFDLHPDRFPLLAALMGNFIMPSTELQDIHSELMSNAAEDRKGDHNLLIYTLIAFCRNLPDAIVNDFEGIANFIFRAEENETERNKKRDRFIKSVQYYLNAAADSHEKYFEIKSVLPCSSGGETAISTDTEQSDDTLTEQLEDTHITDANKEFPSPVCESLSSAVRSASESVVPSPSPSCSHFVPSISAQVLNIARRRHNAALMHPWIHQILTTAEIKLEYCMEEASELPHGWVVWRALRQFVYGLLFDTNHKAYLMREHKRQNKQSPGGDCASGSYPKGTSITVVEHLPVSDPKIPNPQNVPTFSIPWNGVITVEQLWLDDKKEWKRMKCFLLCLLSDSPLMVNPNFVPKHLLVPCAVLRYLISYRGQRLLQKHEIDAFLSTFLSPQLKELDSMQHVPLQHLTVRGVTLSSLFMQLMLILFYGVEHAQFANDACGSPVPWTMFCPWNFFDGKLFQIKLQIAASKQNPMEICNGESQQFSRLILMRQAVLQHLEHMYEPPPPPPVAAPRVPRQLSSAGGQLEVAGKVVGRWGGQKTPVPSLMSLRIPPPRPTLPLFVPIRLQAIHRYHQQTWRGRSRPNVLRPPVP